MRLALIALHFEEFIGEMALELARSHEVLLIVGNPQRLPPEYQEGLLPQGLQVCTLEHRTFRHPLCLATWFRLIRLVRFFSPDVLHIQETPQIYLALSLPFWRKIPLVLEVHDPELHLGEQFSRHQSWAIKRLRQGANQLLVHGQALKEKMSLQSQTPVASIPLGAPLRFKKLTQKPQAPEAHTILMFGRLHAYKGLGVFIEGVQQAARVMPELRAIVAGWGGDLPVYRETLISNPAFEVVDSFIPDEGVGSLFLRASVVVLPYLEGTQSGIIPLAYSFARPVIVTEVGSLPEVVIHEQTGLVIPPQDAAALAKAILRVCRESALWRQRGEQAREVVSKEMSWPTIARQLEIVYNTLLKGDSHPGGVS